MRTYPEYLHATRYGNGNATHLLPHMLNTHHRIPTTDCLSEVQLPRTTFLPPKYTSKD